MSGTAIVRLRACALIEDSGRVLLCREDGDAFWTLPGGSVETGEFSHEALARELGEELGCHRFRIGTPFLVCENLFSWRGQAYQEVVLALHAACEDRALIEREGPFEGAEPHLTFAWMPLAELPSLDLRPSVLTGAILNVRNGGIAHECLRETSSSGAAPEIRRGPFVASGPIG